MRVESFDFDLPDELIALRPAQPRDAARCLVVRNGALQDNVMRDLPVLFDGVPAVVHIEEPRQGIQFGARLDPEDPPNARRVKVKVRDCNTGDSVPPLDDFTAANSVEVPFRPGAPGVINIAALRDRLAAKAPNSGGTLEPNEYALQMLRFPYRQVFGDPQDSEGSKFYALDRFKATVALDTWKSTVATKLGKVQP